MSIGTLITFITVVIVGTNASLLSLWCSHPPVLISRELKAKICDRLIQPQLFNISIIHINDFHARYAEQNKDSNSCKEGEVCVGGIARVYTTVQDLMKKRQNPIFLNAGDNFQGTLYYNMFKWNITQKFMNMFPTSAYTIGNHEFDDKIAGLVPFIEHMKAPMVLSNINDTFHPELQGKYNKSTVVTVGGKKIGIIGVILSTTNTISSTEDLIFLNEVESVNAEAERLKKSDPSIFTIILLSHAGYDVDQQIAAKAAPGISAIVGAHTHTLLYNGVPPDGAQSEGPYPTVVKRESNNDNVLIVQASCYSKYVGDIKISFDHEGKAVAWEGNPIYMDNSVVQDPDIQKELQPFTDAVDKKGDTVIGHTNNLLDYSTCYVHECNVGNFITDAMVWSYEGEQYSAPIAIFNAGGIRSSVSQGDIRYKDMVSCQPFENTWDYIELEGRYIRAVFEKSVADSVRLVQVSGLKIEYDLSQPSGSRVVSIKALSCTSCDNPQYEDLVDDKMYKLIIASFLARGGDNYTEIKDNMKNRRIGGVDIEYLEKYLAAHNPVEKNVEGRIVFQGKLRHGMEMRYRKFK